MRVIRVEETKTAAMNICLTFAEEWTSERQYELFALFPSGQTYPITSSPSHETLELGRLGKRSLGIHVLRNLQMLNHLREQ